MTFAAWVAWLFVLSSPSSSVRHMERAVPLAELDAVYERFAKAYATLDAPSINSLYSEDALYLSPKSDIEGRPDFSGMFERVRNRDQTMSIQFEIVSRRVSGNLATDVGRYDLRYYSDAGEVARSEGKFVVVAERDELGEWKFVVDGYSSIERSP